MDLAIATCRPLPEPDHDEAPLMQALHEAGLTAELLAWNDPTADFSKARLTIVRSTWDYYRHPEAFAQWLDQREGRLANAACVLRWNMHKRYLRELDEEGFAVVPTVLVPRGTGVALTSLLRKKEWLSAVAKPAMGAGSFLTRRVSSSAGDNEWFAERLRERDMLVQPFLPTVQTVGERSLVYIDGQLSHVVHKKPRFDDQSENATLASDATDEERALADRVMRYVVTRLPCGSLLYGRCDLLFDNDGKPMISELELTEPSLFFYKQPAALPKFVNAVKQWLAPLR